MKYKEARCDLIKAIQGAKNVYLFRACLPRAVSRPHLSQLAWKQ